MVDRAVVVPEDGSGRQERHGSRYRRRWRGQQFAHDGLLYLNGGASIVSFNMSETDIRALMRQPWTMTSSDGGLSLPGEGVPHPRNNGAFARKLARYVRDERVVSLDAALHSMTALPAQVFGLAQRGVIRGGAIADIAIFDPAKIQDRATYDNPHQLATGMTHVIVNGKVAWRDGRGTGVRAGVVLRPGT